MKWPFPGNRRITTPWDDPRPVSNPGEHVHGAVDVGTPVGFPIIAPEYGDLFLYASFRQANGKQSWPNDGSNDFPWKNYFYDMYGGIIVLRGISGKTHLFAHIYLNQLHNKKQHDWATIEEKADSRFPLIAMLAGGIPVTAGEMIGKTGNSGFSSGPHCHYEIHNGFEWTPWELRPDPEKIEWEY